MFSSLSSRLRSRVLPTGLALSAAAAAASSASTGPSRLDDAGADDKQNEDNKPVGRRAFGNEGARGTPRMIVRDPDAFARKWKKFSTDGLDRLLVITDFDQTLTPQYRSNGEHASSSHAVLMGSAFVDASVRAAEQKLFRTYFPIEMSPTLTTEEKLPHMIQWWNGSHQALVDSGLRRQQIVDAVTHGDLSFRDGFLEIFRVLAEENVPTLIFSAGLYDVIHEVLHQEFRRHGFETTPPNVHVVSNMMAFDKDGKLSGFQGNLIHCFNKNASVLLDTEFYRQCQMQRRHNIVLLGDSRGDVKMATGLDYDEDEIIRVGFLNLHVQDALDDYLQLYDVVLTDDASLRAVELLIHQIQ
ncbi:hypothetical protein PINS_up008514 [Pythium insidiosum]|nr:hypothetical protein PINS_up008514 [Pythium insidiosum]